VYLKDQIRYVVSRAATPEDLLGELTAELQALVAADPLEIDTTLLIHPLVLVDFLEYNDFLGAADAAVAELGLEGVLQIASFHPHYQFGRLRSGGHRELHQSQSLPDAAPAAGSKRGSRGGRFP